MPVRVSPASASATPSTSLFAQDRDLVEVLEEVARLGARLILQTALEAEVTEFLGRERYARGDRVHAGAPQRLRRDHGQDDRRAGDAAASQAAWHRHRVRVAAVRQGRHPQQRAGDAGDRRLRAWPVDPRRRSLAGRRAGRRRDAVEVHRLPGVRGDRDGVRRLETAPLDDIELEYLYLDASHFRYHDGARSEPVLVAWGVTTDGKPRPVGRPQPARSPPTPRWGSCAAWWRAGCAPRC